jgi:hypothetical protein
MNAEIKLRLPKSYSRNVFWKLSFQHLRRLPSNWMPHFEPAAAEFYLFLVNLTAHTSEELRYTLRRDGKKANKASDRDDWSQELRNFIDELDFEEWFEGDTPDLWSFTYCLETGAPQRFYAFLHKEILYPILWDPNHRHSGGGEILHRKPISCSRRLDCLHP